MAGKWHLGHAQHKMTPIGRGFDKFTGTVCESQYHSTIVPVLLCTSDDYHTVNTRSLLINRYNLIMN